RALVRGRRSAEQVRGARDLDPQPVRRHDPRDALRRGALAGYRGNVLERNHVDPERRRAETAHARRSRRPLHVRRALQARTWRRERVRRVPDAQSAGGEWHGHAVILELLAVRALGAIPLRPFQRRVLREAAVVDPRQLPLLSRLLDEALAMPEAARERWLESLPPAQLSMKAKLRDLLQRNASAETGDFVDILPKLPVVEAVASGGGAPTLEPGTTVGSYVIEQEIGRGGMGAVWRARRSDGVIKRPVALKLPHAGLYTRDLLERFASERDILSELSHPNIARLYDAGFTSTGQPYLALEYVDGVPLTDYCDERRLDVPARLRLFQQVLRAVQYAHASLVIHRDLKPSNVLVGPDGRAMLLDF